MKPELELNSNLKMDVERKELGTFKLPTSIMAFTWLTKANHNLADRNVF